MKIQVDLPDETAEALTARAARLAVAPGELVKAILNETLIGAYSKKITPVDRTSATTSFRQTRMFDTTARRLDMLLFKYPGMSRAIFLDLLLRADDAVIDRAISSALGSAEAPRPGDPFQLPSDPSQFDVFLHCCVQHDAHTEQLSVIIGHFAQFSGASLGSIDPGDIAKLLVRRGIVVQVRSGLVAGVKLRSERLPDPLAL